jgi:hypothetical protein
VSHDNVSIMRLPTSSLLIALGLGCAHTQHQPHRPQTEVYVARSIQYAIRVAQPAAVYHVETPSIVSSSHVLKLAASYQGLVVGKPRTLQQPGAAGQVSAQVRIKILSLEWTTPTQALVRFTLETDAVRSCSVRLQPDTVQPNAWSFLPMGEETCWPRPSPQRPS